MKSTNDPDELKWTKHIESVRKDIECIFGILKCRFRCLLNPIFIHNEYYVDALFITCCVLNNMILQYKLSSYDENVNEILNDVSIEDEGKNSNVDLYTNTEVLSQNNSHLLIENNIHNNSTPTYHISNNRMQYLEHQRAFINHYRYSRSQNEYTNDK